MATTKEFHDYIMDSLLNLRIGEFISKKMMGEYCVYFNNKLIGDICDNVFLLKPTASVKLMHNFVQENGYELDFSDTRLHHEIYLSDPRKCAVEKLQTVIRHPVKK